MILFLGIDPGKSGSICCVDAFGNPELVVRANESYSDIWKSVDKLANNNGCKAVIELVHAMPNQGVVSTFRFGESYGALLGILAATQVPYEKVRPRVWCKEFSLKRDKDEPVSAWKNRHKVLAQSLFPNIKITHANADALLIAEYCRRKNV